MLTPAVITSYDPRGFLRPGFPVWNAGGKKWVDLYCFMGCDGRALIQLLGSGDGKGVRYPMVELSCALEGHEGHLEVISERISRILSELDLNLCGFATFVPEITHHGDAKRSAAVHHLAFLVKLADRLNTRDRAMSVELVTGTSLGSLKVSPTDKVSIEVRENPMNLLIDSLIGIVKLTRDQNVNLAIEMEPGTMYVVGDRKNMSALCDRIDNCHEIREANGMRIPGDLADEVKRRVGLNLDTGHWDLDGRNLSLDGRVDFDRLRAETQILRRVAHCHVSVQDRAHFGDLPLGSKKSMARLKPWLVLLGEIASGTFRNPDDLAPEFDRFVSLELEAVDDTGSVDSSFANLVAALKQENLLSDDY